MNPNTPQHRTTHFLTGIASCAGCGASMLDTGQHYACPQETTRGPDRCVTLPVDAGHLDRMVLQFLVNTLVTPDVLNLQTELLAEDSAQESHRQQLVLEESQSAIAGLNQHAGDLLNQVEHGEKSYQQVDARVMETGRARTELEARATNALDQLERQDCLADQDWVRSSTLDPETYLHPDMLEGSREFFHSFIDAVLIGPESVVIKYTTTPNEYGPPARVLRPRDQPGPAVTPSTRNSLASGKIGFKSRRSTPCSSETTPATERTCQNPPQVFRAEKVICSYREFSARLEYLQLISEEMLPHLQ